MEFHHSKQQIQKFLDTLTGLPKVNDSVIVPVEFYAYNTEKVTFIRTPDIFVYLS